MSLDDLAGQAGALWLLAAVVLGIAELVVPGVFLVFLAIAAAITGVAVFALPDLPGAVQIGSFAVWSAITVLIGKRWYSDYPVETSDPLLNDRTARMIGEIVTVSAAIEDGRGRVVVGDSVWTARGPDAAVGARVRIVGGTSTELQVEPVEGVGVGVLPGL